MQRETNSQEVYLQTPPPIEKIADGKIFLAYVSDNFETTKKLRIFFFFEKIQHFLVQFFSLSLIGGAPSPCTPPLRLCPWTPHDFGLRTLFGTGYCQLHTSNKVYQALWNKFIAFLFL